LQSIVIVCGLCWTLWQTVQGWCPFPGVGVGDCAVAVRKARLSPSAMIERRKALLVDLLEKNRPIATTSISFIIL
jgi:hypothetical protein